MALATLIHVKEVSAQALESHSVYWHSHEIQS